MLNVRSALLAFACAAVLPAGLIACDEAGRGELRAGGVLIVGKVASGLDADAVDHITVDIVGTSTTYSGSVSLTKSGGTWSGRADGLVGGHTYSFSAHAYDASNTELYSASAVNLLVTADQDASLTLNFHAVTPPPAFYNTAPYIVWLTASKAAVAPNEMITLTVGATDPENAGYLSYAWTADVGTVDGLGDTAQWTAPSTAGTATLTVAIDDHNGAVTIGKIEILVKAASSSTGGPPGTRGVDMQARFFEPPSVTAMTVSNGQPTFGQQVGITATTTGGFLEYCDESVNDCSSSLNPTIAWSIDCAAAPYSSYSWLGNGTHQHSFVVASDAAPPSCTVMVLLQDANGAQNQGTTRIALTQPTPTYVDKACVDGIDKRANNAPWVVCRSDTFEAWVSATSAATSLSVYYVDLICQELGYRIALEWGGTSGAVCGYGASDVGSTSCEAPGTPVYDPDATTCGTDGYGRRVCGTVSWRCVK